MKNKMLCKMAGLANYKGYFGWSVSFWQCIKII